MCIINQKEDIYINFENNNSSMIIVTGISGSGKSTLCEKIKKIYNYEIISFDMIFEYEENRERNELEKEIYKKFYKSYPEYKTTNFLHNKDKICNDFFDFVKKYIEDKNIKIIFDGSYFLKRVDFTKIKDQRIILKQTSLLKSLRRRTKRNKEYIYNKGYSKKEIIKEIYHLKLYNIKKIFYWYIERKKFIKKLKKYT